MKEARRILTARDIMAKSLITFRADQSIDDAIKALLKHGISGAPVVDDDKRLIGILSELDCLRTFSSDEPTRLPNIRPMSKRSRGSCQRPETALAHRLLPQP